MAVGVYGDQVLPRMIDKVMDNDDIRALRRQALEGISGVVLEIGFGSGLNVALYPPEVTKLYAIDSAGRGKALAELDGLEIHAIAAGPGLGVQFLHVR